MHDISHIASIQQMNSSRGRVAFCRVRVYNSLNDDDDDGKRRGIRSDGEEKKMCVTYEMI